MSPKPTAFHGRGGEYPC